MCHKECDRDCGQSSGDHSQAPQITLVKEMESTLLAIAFELLFFFFAYHPGVDGNVCVEKRFKMRDEDHLKDEWMYCFSSSREHLSFMSET